MKDELICIPETGPSRDRLAPLRALVADTALWGCLCSMAALSVTGLAPLLPGAAAALLLTLLPGGRARRWAALAVLGLCLGGILVRLPAFLDGCRALLNRFFAASEARQAYTYVRYPLTCPPEQALDRLRWALLPLGLAGGLLLGLAPRWSGPLGAAGLALWAAYLGVSPEPGWCAALAGAALLCLGAPVSGGSRAALLPLGAAAAVFGVLLGGLLLLTPKEVPAISALDEQARDALALRTEAYGEAPAAAETEAPETAAGAFTPLSPEPEPSADRQRALRIALAVLLTAALLFGPAVWNDRRRCRQATLRADLEAEDPRTAIRGAFLYAMRWLCFGGLKTDNLPYGALQDRIGRLYSPELSEAYGKILPLWREAAYSTHAMTEDQRRQMRDWLEQTRRTVRKKLSPGRRLKAALYL